MQGLVRNRIKQNGIVTVGSDCHCERNKADTTHGDRSLRGFLSQYAVLIPPSSPCSFLVTSAKRVQSSDSCNSLHVQSGDSCNSMSSRENPAILYYVQSEDSCNNKNSLKTCYYVYSLAPPAITFQDLQS
jgi:hypothetical protein